ncbi:MAG: hypothetical protein LBU39_01155 [Desulfobulbaceae bacterium]|jgi:phenylacetate-coenzyme A ligase PaaK-like adenylate-forming protein|nr:hypothetical protein [Desulfobulbaceae bacterium]
MNVATNAGLSGLEELLAQDCRLSAQTGGSASGPLSRQQIESYQDERLRRLLAFCRQHSAWHSKNLAGYGDLGLADWFRLPLATADDLRRHGPAMLCLSQDEVARVISVATSATTGPAKRLFFSPADMERTVAFFHRGMKGIVPPGGRLAALLPGKTPDGTGDLLRRAMMRLPAKIVCFGLVADTCEMARRLADFQPDAIAGFPVQILAVARMAEVLQRPLSAVRAVLLCSDYIAAAARTALSALLHCQIFSHYGTTESGLGGAVDCRQQAGMHIRENDLFIEIIAPENTQPLADGSWGEIVLTTLTREAMPLIRYRTGDLGRLLPGSCPCGSHIKRLDRVLGRIKAVHHLANGSSLALRHLDEALLPLPGLLDYRARLTDDAGGYRLDLHLSCLPGTSEASARQAMAAAGAVPPCAGLEIKIQTEESGFIQAGKRILNEGRKGQA